MVRGFAPRFMLTLRASHHRAMGRGPVGVPWRVDVPLLSPSSSLSSSSSSSCPPHTIRGGA
eukprot:3397915-Pyramimonas_sp.AAC.1